MPQGSTLTVIDRTVVILARYPDPEKWVGKAAPEARIVQIVLTRGEGVAEAPRVDGVPSLLGFTPLGGRSGAGAVYVSIGIPASTAIAPNGDILIADPNAFGGPGA